MKTHSESKDTDKDKAQSQTLPVPAVRRDLIQSRRRLASLTVELTVER